MNPWILVAGLVGFILGAALTAVLAAIYFNRLAPQIQEGFGFMRRALIALCVKNKVSQEHCDGPDAIKTRELVAGRAGGQYPSI